MRVLVLGASGMLGNAVLNVFVNKGIHDVWGTIRSSSSKHLFTDKLQSHLISGVDVLEHDKLLQLLTQARPDVVINCVGVIKQLENANDPLVILPVNALLPHRLAKLCGLMGARLIHISTDCVFSGDKGGYSEADESDARDLYGKSKYMGEVSDYSHAITLRTSIIGHELNSSHALVDWFLAQKNQVRGYTRAIFSGLPTFELAEVIHDLVLPEWNLHGLYHVSAQPIAKFDLLKIISTTYQKQILIEPDEEFVIDRSLDSTRFQQATGYRASSWPVLIKKMHKANQG